MIGELDVGAVVAGHRIDAVAGQGGMGVVYRATHLGLRRMVALKVMAPWLAADPDFRARFEREARLAARLEHPHVVPVYEAGHSDGLLYLSMRYVDGTDLGKLVAAGPMDLDRTCRLLAQVARALDAAHAAGLVHRDVKPANILITRDRPEHAFLSDFGVTTTIDGTRTSTAGVKGTLAYLAPECFTGAPPAGASDRYALAVVAFQCLTGRLPFECSSLGAYVNAHLNLSPPRLRSLRPELPERLEAVIATGLAKSPAARHQSCAALVDALAAPTPTPTRTLPAERAVPPRTPLLRRRAVVTAAASALVVVPVALLAQRFATPEPADGAGTEVPPPAEQRPVVPPLGTAEVGSAAQVKLSFPYGVGVDSAGRVYIADSGNLRVRQVDGDRISTVAGTGEGGDNGDGGPATAARSTCHGVTVGPDGAVLFAAIENNNVRRVGPDGIIGTLAGTGSRGDTGDGGPATAAQLSGPWDLAVAPDGTVYVADTNNNRIRRVDPGGTITTVAGTGVGGVTGDGGPATSAQLAGPRDVAVGPDGSLYIADGQNHRVRRVDPAGRISTVAGTGTAGFSGDGGPAVAAQLNNPHGVEIDASGALLVADLYNNRIRRVDPGGTITTVAGSSYGFAGDGGPAVAARLAYPRAVAAYSDGSLYIADINNHRIRRVAPDGTITTVAGIG